MLSGKDKISLSVSHENIIHSFHQISKQGVLDRFWVVGPNREPKKLKEKPLKEITSKLEAQPINLKRGHTRLRQIIEKLSRSSEEQVGLFTTEGNIGGPSHFHFSPKPIAPSSNNGQVGVHETTSLDPDQRPSHKATFASPDAPNPSFIPESYERAQVEQSMDKGNGAGKLMQKERWSDCQLEEAMDITTLMP